MEKLGKKLSEIAQIKYVPQWEECLGLKKMEEEEKENQHSNGGQVSGDGKKAKTKRRKEEGQKI